MRLNPYPDEIVSLYLSAPAPICTHVSHGETAAPVRYDPDVTMQGSLSAKCLFLVALASSSAIAQSLPRGEIVDDVQCLSDTSQHYALYLPTYFSQSRRWPIILAFDGSGHGRAGVESYRAAAEKYGYIVVGSNNSRNGPWEVGLDAGGAMMSDVTQRFPVDAKRMYTAGLSGGARVAIMLAEKSTDIAGVFASSAGYSTGLRRTQRFPIFGSAGTEDFNYHEMRTVDSAMTSPHRVEFFEGGHTWLPSEMAIRAVEWMEVLAMKNGQRSVEDALLAELFSKRLARANAERNDLRRMRELKQIAADFEGLRDVTAIVDSASALQHEQAVTAALNAEQAEDARESRVQEQLDLLVHELGWPERADTAVVRLKTFVGSLLDIARQPNDSSDRRVARRTLAGLRAERRGVTNQDVQQWIDSIQIPEPPQSR